MPGGNKTGPMGRGPMTGRGAGNCEGNPVPGVVNTPAGGGRGSGGGRGQGGRRRRNRFRAAELTGLQEAPTGVPAAADRQQEAASQTSPDPTSLAWKQQALDLLKSEAEEYAKGLEQMKKRIAELETDFQEE